MEDWANIAHESCRRTGRRFSSEALVRLVSGNILPEAVIGHVSFQARGSGHRLVLPKSPGQSLSRGGCAGSGIQVPVANEYKLRP